MTLCSSTDSHRMTVIQTKRRPCIGSNPRSHSDLEQAFHSATRLNICLNPRNPKQCHKNKDFSSLSSLRLPSVQPRSPQLRRLLPGRSQILSCQAGTRRQKNFPKNVSITSLLNAKVSLTNTNMSNQKSRPIKIVRPQTPCFRSSLARTFHNLRQVEGSR